MTDTTSQQSQAWHAAEDAQERAWLDDWMRGRICPATLTPRPAALPEQDRVPSGRA